MSNKFSEEEIIKIIDVLIGPIDAVGETNADKIYLQNLNMLIHIVDHYFTVIEYCSKFDGRPEASMNDIGNTAKLYLIAMKHWLEVADERNG